MRAIVQGGLTTAMELTANRRPFLYFPLNMSEIPAKWLWASFPTVNLIYLITC